jgi:hypothetical protein
MVLMSAGRKLLDFTLGKLLDAGTWLLLLLLPRLLLLLSNLLLLLLLLSNSLLLLLLNPLLLLLKTVVVVVVPGVRVMRVFSQQLLGLLLLKGLFEW